MNTATLRGEHASTPVLPAHPERRPDFRRLLGDAAWSRLPPAVHARFDGHAHSAEATLYRGEMRVRASRGGRWLAQLCRLIGTPVAPYVGDAVPIQVRVFDTPQGVVWERRYAFAGRTPVIVRSTKQLDDDGMLVEALNAGLHMRLRVFEERGELHFLSTGYYFRAGPLRFNLPDWFLPGATHVVHEDLGAGRFRFGMRTNHHWFGEMFFQDGVFQ
ncbi:MAG TPA: DUF4166 domain-containing protein [Povalibacter sp.]